MNNFKLTKYKDIFGKAGEGVHQYKFKGTSIVDYLLTIIGAFIITYYTDIPLVLTTIGLFLIGILLHYLFGLETQVIKFIHNII